MEIVVSERTSGIAESLARLKIATMEKMNARVQVKTEPRIAPPTAMLILNEKCASIVLTTWPRVRLKSSAKKTPNAATMRRKARGGKCCCGKPGKKKAGRCQSAQLIAITSAAIRGVSQRSRRGRRKALHPSSSPIAPVTICSPTVMGRAASGINAAPKCKCLTMIIADATAATGTRTPIKYHDLFFENRRNRKPSRLRTPEAPSKEKDKANAITVGDHTVTNKNVKSAHKCPAANVERKSKQANHVTALARTMKARTGPHSEDEDSRTVASFRTESRRPTNYAPLGAALREQFRRASKLPPFESHRRRSCYLRSLRKRTAIVLVFPAIRTFERSR